MELRELDLAALDKERICCFTGHRTLGTDFRPKLAYSFMEYLVDFRNIDTFICGGALGYDVEMGYLVLKLKQTRPKVKLWMFLPCTDQSARWSYSDKKRYEELLSRADLIDCPPTTYNNTVMRTRNYKMVDYSRHCLTYFNGKQISGTAQTVRYAKRNGLLIYNLAQDGKRIIDEL